MEVAKIRQNLVSFGAQFCSSFRFLIRVNWYDFFWAFFPILCDTELTAVWNLICWVLTSFFAHYHRSRVCKMLWWPTVPHVHFWMDFLHCCTHAWSIHSCDVSSLLAKRSALTDTHTTLLHGAFALLLGQQAFAKGRRLCLSLLYCWACCFWRFAPCSQMLQIKTGLGTCHAPWQ